MPQIYFPAGKWMSSFCANHQQHVTGFCKTGSHPGQSRACQIDTALHVPAVHVSLQMDHMRQVHQDDMQLMHDRVASIVKRKDAQIISLSEQAVQLRIKLVNFDDMIAREKKNLLIVCDTAD